MSLRKVGGTGNLGKRLEWRDQDETWLESTSLRYVIDITGLNPLSLEELEGELIRKIRKVEVFFNLRTGDCSRGIFKFYI